MHFDGYNFNREESTQGLIVGLTDVTLYKVSSSSPMAAITPEMTANTSSFFFSAGAASVTAGLTGSAAGNPAFLSLK